MNGQGDAISIEILDKEYRVSCPPEEKEALLESARILNERLKSARDGGKVLGTERMAVMTALNLVHECTQLKREQEEYRNAVDTTVDRLQHKIANAIGRRDNDDEVD